MRVDFDFGASCRNGLSDRPAKRRRAAADIGNCVVLGRQPFQPTGSARATSLRWRGVNVFGEFAIGEFAMVRIVAGWFEDQVAAQRALESLRTAGVESDELFTFVVIRRVCTMACRLVATKWPIRQARAAEVGALCDAARHPSYPT